MAPDEVTRRFGAAITLSRSAHFYGDVFDFGEYPVLMENPSGGVVPGVLLDISNFEEAAARFDVYEGANDPCPVFFRSLREVAVEGFRRIPAWVYLGNRNNRFVRDRLPKARRLTALWNKPGLRKDSRLFPGGGA
jgi:hypothetical protein